MKSLGFNRLMVVLFYFAFSGLVHAESKQAACEKAGGSWKSDPAPGFCFTMLEGEEADPVELLDIEDPDLQTTSNTNNTSNPGTKPVKKLNPKGKNHTKVIKKAKQDHEKTHTAQQKKKSDKKDN